MRQNLILLIFFFFSLPIFGQEEQPHFSDLVPYVTTPEDVIDEILKLAEVNNSDILIDLGSGDGRIPIRAAQKFGIKALGVEIDADLIKQSKQNAKDAGVSDLVEFEQGDLFGMDFSEATVVILYLFPDINEKLMPRLKAMKSGTRIVSHKYPIGDWKPEKILEFESEEGRIHKLLFFRVP